MDLVVIDVSEFRKMDGGLSCLSPLVCGLGVGVAGGGITVTVGVGVGPPAPTVVMTGGPGMGGVVSLSIRVAGSS